MKFPEAQGIKIYGSQYSNHSLFCLEKKENIILFSSSILQLYLKYFSTLVIISENCVGEVLCISYKTK